MAELLRVTARTVLRPPASLRPGLQAAMARTVRPTLVTGTIVFALVLPLDVTLENVPAGLLLLHATSLGFFLAGLVANARWRVSPANAGAVLFAFALVGLANCAVALLAMPANSSQVSFATLILGCGIILLSWPWLAAAIVATVAVWAASAVVISPADRASFLVTLLIACVLSGLLVYARRQGHLVAVRANAEVEESERRWRQLVQNAPDRILTVDLEGRIVFVNHLDAAASQRSVLGRPYIEFVAPADRARLAAAFEKVRREGSPAYCEAAVHSPDGRSLAFKSSIGPLFHDGELTGFMVIATDITREKNAEVERMRLEEKQREIERLKSLDAFKTQFINTAAHEIGTPLTPIRLQLHLLRVTQSPRMSEDGIHSLDVVDRNVARLGALLTDVLDAARLEAGRLQLRVATTDLARVVDEAVETFAEQARTNGVELRADIAPGLTVDGDAKRLSQVVFNFLSNALKFTPDGGRIVVTAQPADGGDASSVLVRVKDSGPGIPAEQARRLFQPFTQVHETSKAKHAGTGLGLFISRGIIEQHGGRIWVEAPDPAEPGAAFCFLVPARAAGVGA